MGLMINPAPTFTLNNGDIASEGKLHFFENGSTSIRKPVYLDPELVNQLNNPLTLTDAGRLPTCFGTGTYTIVLESADEVQQWVRNDIAIDDMTGQFADYSSVKIYLTNEIVRYTDGNYYFSLKNNNRGNVPADNSEWWSQIGFLEFFNSSKAADNAYELNDIVISGGFLYRSLENDNGDTPPSAKWANLTFNDSVAGDFAVGGGITIGAEIVISNANGSLHINSEGEISADGINYNAIKTTANDQPKITLSPVNGYTFPTLSARVTDGILYIYGIAQSPFEPTETPLLMTTLPEGYRPAEYRNCVAIDHEIGEPFTPVATKVGILSNGQIQWVKASPARILVLEIAVPLI